MYVHLTLQLKRPWSNTRGVTCFKLVLDYTTGKQFEYEANRNKLYQQYVFIIRKSVVQYLIIAYD